jgi:hypothetical protein
MHSANVTESVSATMADIKKYANSDHNHRYYNDNDNYLINYEYYSDNENGYNHMPAPITAAFDSLPGTAERQKMSIVVSEPGVYLVPNISTNSEGAFNYVFFPEKGKFSLVKIYKFMRSAAGRSWKGVGLSIDRIPGYLEHPRVIKDNQKSTTNNSELATIMKRELPRVLPYGLDDVAELKKNAIFKAIQRKVKTLDFLKKVANKKKTVVADATVDPYAKYMVFEGRYIPLVSTIANDIYTDYYGYQRQAQTLSYVGADGKLISTKTDILPNVNGTQVLSNGLVALVRSSNPLLGHAPPNTSRDYRGWYSQILTILFYDVTTSTVVMAPELSTQAHAAMLAASVAKTASYSTEITALLNSESGADFLARANKYMMSRGFVNFKITKATPIYFRDSAENENWTNGQHNSYLGGFKPSFNIEVQYNGEPLIGSNGASYNGVGHLIAEADDKGRIVMVQSAWCQRVSKWTKQHSIDQKNRDWLLDDWLAGPNAERMGMQIKEAPIVYYGNNANKTDRKAAILKKMRQMQHNL